MNTPSAMGGAEGQFTRPLSDSLFAATARLETVIAAFPVIDPWSAQLQAALRECTAAVQYHLESIDGGDGMKEHVSIEEPRLLSRLERLDEELKHLLPELQDARAASADTTRTLIEPLAHIVEELHHAADGELTLLYDALSPIGIGD